MILPGTGRGTSRRLVEGPTLAMIHNIPQGRVHIPQDIARSNSQRLKSQFSKRSIAS